jgi:acetyl esterase/lipase
MRIALAVGLWFTLIALAVSQDAPPVVPLWEKGAPGFEDRRGEAEKGQPGRITNVHNPSLTVFLPPSDKATGAGIVVCPGGGHFQLSWNLEGTDAARSLNEIGVAAFVLKYRLAREQGAPYKIETHAKEDGQRAMRLVRSRAEEWKLDPKKIGIMGFSAGGEVVSMVSYSPGEGAADAADPIDRVSCRPDFQIMVYPGPLGIPETIPAGAPPALLVVANDDRGAAGNIANLLTRLRAARVPVEAHVFAQGGHAFGMGGRSRFAAVKAWPQRLAEWMGDNVINPPATTRGR